MIDLRFNKESQKALKNLKGLVTNDDLRPQLAYISFRNGYLYAVGAQASSLIRVPLEFYGFTAADIELLNGKYLHIEDLLELASCDSIEVRAEEMIGIRGTRKILCNFAELSDYPPVETVFPERNDVGRANITFNVKVLNSLVAAFVENRRIVATDCYSSGASNPVLVVPYYGDATFDSEDNAREQEGVIMPIIKNV